VKSAERETAGVRTAGGKFSALVLAMPWRTIGRRPGRSLGIALRPAGAMAQQVAHLLCKQGVRGSSPLGSTLVRATFEGFGEPVLT
jgi:hypothetical protein